MFEFDLGGSLVVEPDESEPDSPPDELWSLFEHNGKVLTLRADGTYKYQPGNTPPAHERYTLLCF